MVSIGCEELDFKWLGLNESSTRCPSCQLTTFNQRNEADLDSGGQFLIVRTHIKRWK